MKNHQTGQRDPGISGTTTNSPIDYLTTVQDTDGGIKDTDLNTKIWETAYVASALSGKTWNQIMQTFPKESLPTASISTPTQASTSIPTPQTENTNVVSIKSTENKIAKIKS